MTAAKQFEPIAVEDYLAGELHSDVKHEYLGGYVYAMPGARNVHNSIASSWLLAIGTRLRGKPCEPFNSDTKVRIPGHPRPSFYYPDGMVVCEPNDPEESFQERPVVIAEVVSEATRGTDEREKRLAYQALPTLDVYMVIETDTPRVAVHRRVGDGFITEIYDSLESVIALESIEAELPLAELYERVNFTGESQVADGDR